LFSQDFLGGPRPFGYPLYLKLVAHNDAATVLGQLVLSTAAWLFLAAMVARITRHHVLKVVGFGLVCGLGATFEALQWDRVVSSESLSTACGVGLLAALLLLRERWTWPRFALAAALALVATLLRDSNGTFLAVVAVMIAGGVVIRRLPRHALALVAAFLVVAAIGSSSASSGRRWEGPLKDVITLRVLESPERTKFFVDEGFPLTPDELDLARGNCVSPAPPTVCAVIPNPALYVWVHDHGRQTYLKSMVRFPDTTLWEPVAHLRDSIGTRVRVEHPLATATEEKAPVSHFLEATLFWRNPALVAFVALALLGLCIVAYARGLRGPYWIGAALLVFAYAHLWLVWMGGALEVARHSLLASVQIRLGIWLAALWLLDAFLTTRSSQVTEASSHARTT
jgi:hypothetical protein